jgi:subtilisin family serine protease
MSLERIPEHARESPFEPILEDVRVHAGPDAPADGEVAVCEAVRSLEPTGRGVRIAVIDSGVFATHPHVGGVAGGVAIALDGSEHGDFVDRLGHGTAVTAAIKEKAADAEIYAVKVFDRVLSTNVTSLVHAIEWAARWDIKLVNLSLGTQRDEHELVLAAAVAHAARYGVIIVAADSDVTPEGTRVRWLPGSLPGVVPVIADWDCPREEFRVDATGEDGRAVFRASPYPRPVPGVPPARNLKGISFAVANMTGFVARVLESSPAATIDDIWRLLREQASPIERE